MKRDKSHKIISQRDLNLKKRYRNMTRIKKCPSIYKIKITILYELVKATSKQSIHIKKEIKIWTDRKT
jgi:hypothetical protein